MRAVLAVAVLCFLVSASLVPLAAATILPASKASVLPRETAATPVTLERVLEAGRGGKFPLEVHERLADPITRNGLMQAYYVGDVDLAKLEGRFVVLGDYRSMDGGLVLTDPQGFEALARHPAVTFLSPDHPIEFHTAEGSVTVGARSVAGAKNDGPAIWYYDAATDSLKSDTTDLGFADVITGDSVTVASIDSGIDRTHQDFGGWHCEPRPYQPCESRIDLALKVSHLLMDTDGAREGDVLPTTEAASGHGTHTAGTIAGNAWYARRMEYSGLPWIPYGADNRPFGMAPEARLISLSVGDAASAGLAGFGLDWLAAGDNAERYNVRVASNSWGCQSGCAYNPNAPDALAIKKLYGLGVAVVFSAGNAGAAANTMGDNAKNPWALGIANFDDDSGSIAASSSRGNEDHLPDPATWTPEDEAATASGGHHNRPDLTAPGTSIFAPASLTGGYASLLPRIDPTDVVQDGSLPQSTAYAPMSGTSMAAPHVSGIAALLIDACPQAQVLDIYRSLKASATQSSVKVAGTLAARHVGYGVPDARLALEWLVDNVPSCTGGSVPLTVTLADKSVMTGEPVTLDAGVSGGDGSAPAWSWSLATPAGSSATLSSTTAPNPTFTPDVAGVYEVDVQLTVGSETATANAQVTATAPVQADMTLYLRSSEAGPTFVGTVDQQISAQPLSPELPPNLGASTAFDPANAWDSSLLSALPGGRVPAGPNPAVELVWQTTQSHSIVDQEVVATLWFETYSAFNHAGMCPPTLRLALWANNGSGWTNVVSKEVDGPMAEILTQTEAKVSLGVVAQATGRLAFTVNLPYFDCNGPNMVLYDDVDFASRIEVLSPIDANAPPVADAGADQTADEGDAVVLAGSGTDADGSIASHAWTQTSGPEVALSGADSATAGFTAPQVRGDEILGFRLTVTDDEGATATDSVTVTIRDTNIIGPRVAITDPQDGATVDASLPLPVAGVYDPQFDFGQPEGGLAVATAWQDPGQGGNGDYVLIDRPAGGAVAGVTELAGRAGTSPTDPDGGDGDCESDCRYDFGEPQADDLRPGDLSSVCTLNFLYEHRDADTGAYRYFFGSAAHCAATGDSTDTNGCTVAPNPIGSTEQLSGSDGQDITAKLAYSSWATMQRVRETDEDACYGNDFALFEIDADDLDKVHPAVRMYGGPTGLGHLEDMELGDEVRGYGRSFLHDDTLLLDAEQSLLNPKDGVFMGDNNGGWSYYVNLVPAGVPGDSGGGIMDVHGKALGAASTINGYGLDFGKPQVTTPGSNNYANIARALDYMRAKEGWAPTLVTWDSFDAEPRPDAYGVPASGPQHEPRRAPTETALPIAGGVAAEVGTPVLGNDVSHVTIRLPLEGQLDGQIPSSSGTPLSYEVAFGASNNGIPQTYRVSYERSAYDWRKLLLQQDVDPANVMVDLFGFYVDTAPDATSGFSYICPVAVDISGSHVDQATGDVVWKVPLDGFKQSNRPAGANCAAFANTGRALQTGDKLTGIAASVILTTANVNHGNAYGAFGESTAPDYTLGDTAQYVTLTVNGVAAGQAILDSDGTWTHAIDFDGFTPAGGRFEVAAAFRTATETKSYSATPADPCSLSARIEVTLDGMTACTAYDPATSGDWNVAFDDLSGLAEGSHTLTATAYESASGALSTHSVTITIPSSNRAPTLMVDDQQGREGEQMQFTIDASDPDGDDLTIDVAGLPGGATLDGLTITWSPGFDDAGTYALTVTVSDGRETVSKDFQLVIANVNRAPTVHADDQTGAEGQPLAFPVTASDADGDALDVQVGGLPDGAAFDGATVSWTPGYDDAGTYTLTLSASDGEDTTTHDVTVTITDVNRAPSAAPIGARQAKEGEPFSLTVAASDPDGDALGYTGDLPAGARLDSNVFTWTPSYTQAGTYTVTFTVSDGRGGTDTTTMTLTVANVNRAPVVADVSDKSVRAGTTVRFTVTASDPDGDRVTLTAGTLPKGATFDAGTGVFTWHTKNRDVGTTALTFTASDGSLSDDDVVKVTVTKSNSDEGDA